MIIDNKFDIGEVVFLSTDIDQCTRVVTGITVKPHGLIYALSCGSSESWHYDFEITIEKDILMTTNN